MAARRIFFSAHYAMLDTRTPFVLLAISLGLSLLLYPGLFFSLGAVGLALTLPIIRLLIAAIAGWLLFRRIGLLSNSLLLFVAKVGNGLRKVLPPS